jgi:hypothetical protein
MEPLAAIRGRGGISAYVLHMKSSTCIDIEFLKRDKLTQLDPV